jgi:TRAP-type C4-dicarboxylate transport system permease small subunit
VLGKIWNRLEEILLVSSLAFTVGLIFIQVLMRYVFQNSLSWSEELARYLFLWQIWLGASFAVKEQAHLRIGALVDNVPPKAKRAMEFAALLAWFAFSLFLAVKGSELALLLLKRGQVSPAMRMPMAYAYASVPVGSALMAIRLVEEMVRFFRRPPTGEVG